MTEQNENENEEEIIAEEYQIFCVEDNENIREIIRFSLERAGFNVSIATDGREASTHIQEHPPPDVVLLDVLLPYKDGFELVEEIKNKPSWSSVPIMMVTAKDDEQDVLRALDEGVNDYIKKPFNPKELVARVKRYCNGDS